MKTYVGIDIAQFNHFAAAISSDSEIIIEPFKFTNDADGFHLLVSKLESFDKNSIIIGPRQRHTTATTLFTTLLLSFTKCVLNPIKTCQMRKITFTKQRQIRSTHM